jgi:hypothetical protein
MLLLDPPIISPKEVIFFYNVVSIVEAPLGLVSQVFLPSLLRSRSKVMELPFTGSLCLLCPSALTSESVSDRISFARSFAGIIPRCLLLWG